MSEVSLSETMTSLMNSARKHFEVKQKLSIPNLINLFNPNPNLLTGIKDFSGEWVGLDKWVEDGAYKGLKVLKKSTLWSGCYQEFQVEAGKTYTFSAYVKQDEASNDSSIYILSTSVIGTAPTRDNNHPIDVTTDWQRVSASFYCEYSGTIDPRLEMNAEHGYMYICGYKLEEGSLATPLTELGGVIRKHLADLLPSRMEVAA